MADLMVLDHAEHCHFVDSLNEHLAFQVSFFIEFCQEVLSFALQLLHELLRCLFLGLGHHLPAAADLSILTIRCESLTQVRLVGNWSHCSDFFSLFVMTLIELLQALLLELLSALGPNLELARQVHLLVSSLLDAAGAVRPVKLDF